jgi:hypothetical protein
MPTILPKKAGQENPIATNDDHHDALAADPTITQFPQGSSYGTTTPSSTNPLSSGASAFNTSPTTGFGSTSGFSTSTGFGAPTSGFGNNTNSGPVNQPVLTGGGSNAAQGADVLVENDNTDWINKKWRPLMGWMYMVVCICDFTLFPILWSILQALSHGQVTSQWQPVTLQGAGLFHVAMGAVLGVAAYGRTKEKIEGKS